MVPSCPRVKAVPHFDEFRSGSEAFHDVVKISYSSQRFLGDMGQHENSSEGDKSVSRNPILFRPGRTGFYIKNHVLSKPLLERKAKTPYFPHRVLPRVLFCSRISFLSALLTHQRQLFPLAKAPIFPHSGQRMSISISIFTSGSLTAFPPAPVQLVSSPLYTLRASSEIS